MKTLLLLLSIIIISGCSTPSPVTIPFPDAPPQLVERCGELTLVNQDPLLSEVVRTVTENYVKYHECSRKVMSWNEWYESQKEIYNAAINSRSKK